MNKTNYPEWTLIDWPGNPALKLKCWAKSFGKQGTVYVGAGEFLTVCFSYGASSYRSYSSTRWNYANPPMTEQEAMDGVDAGNGLEMLRTVTAP